MYDSAYIKLLAHIKIELLQEKITPYFGLYHGAISECIKEMLFFFFFEETTAKETL